MNLGGWILAAVATQAAQPAPVTLVEQAPPPSVVHWTFMSGKAGYHVIQADITSGRASAEILYSDHRTSSWDLISQSEPYATVTGSFFAYETGQPVADTIVNGSLVSKGRVGSVLALDWFGRVAIIDPPKGVEMDYSAFRHAIRGCVRILRDQEVAIDPKSQGFRDPAIWGRARRSCVGITEFGKLLLIATKNSVTLGELARAAKEAGAYDAVCLDGGGSTMMYMEGKMLIPTSRRLCTLVAVHEKGPEEIGYQALVTGTE